MVRPGTQAQVAKAIACLISDAFSDMAGQRLCVEGDFVAPVIGGLLCAQSAASTEQR